MSLLEVDFSLRRNQDMACLLALYTVTQVRERQVTITKKKSSTTLLWGLVHKGKEGWTEEREGGSPSISVVSYSASLSLSADSCLYVHGAGQPLWAAKTETTSVGQPCSPHITFPWWVYMYMYMYVHVCDQICKNPTLNFCIHASLPPSILPILMATLQSDVAHDGAIVDAHA